MAEFIVLLWCLAFLALGAAFGGLVGALSWRRGQTVGTGLSLAAVRLAMRTLGVEWPRTVQGAAVGACDGALLFGSLLAVALLIPPVREQLVAAVAHGSTALLAVGVLMLVAAGFGAVAWVIRSLPTSHLIEAVLGCGILVAFCTYMAAQFKWQYPWAYGVGVGVLTLLLVYVVFPGRRPAIPPRSPQKLSDDAILQLKIKPPSPPDEHVQSEREG